MQYMAISGTRKRHARRGHARVETVDSLPISPLPWPAPPAGLESQPRVSSTQAERRRMGEARRCVWARAAWLSVICGTRMCEGLEATFKAGSCLVAAAALRGGESLARRSPSQLSTPAGTWRTRSPYAPSVTLQPIARSAHTSAVVCTIAHAAGCQRGTAWHSPQASTFSKAAHVSRQQSLVVHIQCYQ